MDKIEKNVSYFYRYFWKAVDGSLHVQYICGSMEEHEKVCQKFVSDSDVVSAMREYVHEIDCNFIGVTHAVKEEKKEEN